MLTKPWQRMVFSLIVIAAVVALILVAFSGGKATLAPVVSYTLRGLVLVGLVGASGYLASRRRKR